MEELFISTDIFDRLGNRLIADKNIELSLVEHYKLEREDVDMYTLAANELFKHYYGDTTQRHFSNVETFFRENKFVTIIAVFIETVDIILLNKIKDVDFENIIYNRKSDKGYYFKVIPRIIKE